MLNRRPTIEMSIAPLSKDSYRLVREQLINNIIKYGIDSDDYWAHKNNTKWEGKLTAELLSDELARIAVIVATVIPGERDTNKYLPFYLLDQDDKDYLIEDIIQDIKRRWNIKD